MSCAGSDDAAASMNADQESTPLSISHLFEGICKEIPLYKVRRHMRVMRLVERTGTGSATGSGFCLGCDDQELCEVLVL